jgi:hypothetical protein
MKTAHKNQGLVPLLHKTQSQNHGLEPLCQVGIEQIEEIYLIQEPTHVIVYFSFTFYSYWLNTSSTHETSLMSCFWINTNAMVLEECRGYSYIYCLQRI